ncbi:DNA polymerase epsilon noncatalytic subunit [Saccharomyces eubayanus]|uniref:DNA polymerase epsilon noncatalytic subunit n=1 Tax=Saccharomyces eubayanus TaxID=1080349 RepID=UPI0006C0E188|nr:DPB2-like protein [Saccharomyces eubayanus]KOG96457.1 DPB2-like protein [Saccharomyces eubayanus]
MFSSGSVLPVKIQPPLLRPLAYRVLSRKYGLSIKSDGLSALAEFVGTNIGTNWRQGSATIRFLEQFATVWKQQERGLFIDQDGVKEVIQEMKEREKAEWSHEHPTQHGDDILRHSGDDSDDDMPMAADSSLQNALLSSPIRDPINENKHNVSSRLEKSKNLDWRDYFKVINASQQQRFSYNPRKMQFIFVANKKENLLGSSTGFLPDIADKVQMFLTRYYLTNDRVMRNENFQNSDMFNPLSSMVSLQNELSNAGQKQQFNSMNITPIKNLLGRDAQNFLILGLLNKNFKGNWSIEDPSGSVEIDISQTIPTQGHYYAPGCMVLVEGIYYSVGNKFHVTSMTLPPGERREITLETMGNLDLLGIHGLSNNNFIARLDKDLKIRLHLLEKELTDHKFIILGADLFLDDLRIMTALSKILQKLNDDPPTLLIWQGSFTSIPVFASMSSRNVSSSTQYKNNFDALATLLSQYDNLTERTTMIFIPGPNDLWGSMISLGANGILPQDAIPSVFTKKMNKVCKNIIWSSNPTRIAYLSQEIVLFRDDLTERFKRHHLEFAFNENEESYTESANTTTKDTDIVPIDELVKNPDQLPQKVQESRKLVKTILDQGHLSPFVDSIRPISWDLDHTLTLCPIPSTMILCDTTSAQFDLTYNGCKVINPGSFIHNRRARYMEYIPSTKKTIQEEIYF